MKNKRKITSFCEWLVAFAVSFFIANFLLSFYFYDPGWIKRDTGATRGIYEPNSTIVRADEGYTITNVDENGYINESLTLCEQGYTLVMGNSQANGNNVMPEQKWISLLNENIRMHENDEADYVYNMSVGGYDYCDIISGIPAAISEFPDSDTLIIQIITTDLPVDKLGNCLDSREFSEDTRGNVLKDNLTLSQKVRNVVKNYFPLITYIYELKLSKLENSFEDAFFYKIPAASSVLERRVTDDYTMALNETMVFLTENYDGEIIVLYLPSCSITEEGLVCVKEVTEPIFRECCEENGILYCNMSDAFQTNYEQAQCVPYGFSNTQLGTGHLNVDGHKMVADTLYTLWLKTRDN